MNDNLGWLFSEIAFRGWDAMPEWAFKDQEPRWWALPFDKLMDASYRVGCFFYGRACA